MAANDHHGVSEQGILIKEDLLGMKKDSLSEFFEEGVLCFQIRYGVYLRIPNVSISCRYFSISLRER